MLHSSVPQQHNYLGPPPRHTEIGTVSLPTREQIHPPKFSHAVP